MVGCLESINKIHQFLVIWWFLPCFTWTDLFAWIEITHGRFRTNSPVFGSIHLWCCFVGCVQCTITIWTLILGEPVTPIMVISICILQHRSTLYSIHVYDWHVALIHNVFIFCCHSLQNYLFMDPQCNFESHTFTIVGCEIPPRGLDLVLTFTFQVHSNFNFCGSFSFPIMHYIIHFGHQLSFWPHVLGGICYKENWNLYATHPPRGQIPPIDI